MHNTHNHAHYNDKHTRPHAPVVLVDLIRDPQNLPGTLFVHQSPERSVHTQSNNDVNVMNIAHNIQNIYKYINITHIMHTHTHTHAYMHAQY